MDQDQQKIVTFLQQYKDSWKDSRSLRAILADCIPEKKALRNILAIAYDEGVYAELQECSDTNRVIFKYKKILVDDYAIGEESAAWAIETWQLILSVDKKQEDYTNDEIDSKKLDRMKVKLLQLATDNKTMKRSKKECVGLLKRAVEQTLYDI